MLRVTKLSNIKSKITKYLWFKQLNYTKMKIRKLFFIYVIIFFSLSATPQGNLVKIKHYSYSGDIEEFTVNLSVFNYSEDASIPSIISEIMGQIGLNKNFRIKAETDIANAAAAMILSERYLFYNPSWIKQVKISSGTNWTIYSIMAHEIGHHLNAHTLDDKGSTPPKELEADEFSGFILNKLDASLNDSQLAMKMMGNDLGSATHPPKTQRLAAIKLGWDKANSFRRDDDKVDPIPPDPSSPRDCVEIIERISYQNTNPNNFYQYVRGYQVKNICNKPIRLTLELNVGYYQDCIKDISNFVSNEIIYGYVTISPSETKTIEVRTDYLPGRLSINKCTGVSKPVLKVKYQSEN